MIPLGADRRVRVAPGDELSLIPPLTEVVGGISALGADDAAASRAAKARSTSSSPARLASSDRRKLQMLAFNICFCQADMKAKLSLRSVTQ